MVMEGEGGAGVATCGAGVATGGGGAGRFFLELVDKVDAMDLWLARRALLGNGIGSGDGAVFLKCITKVDNLKGTYVRAGLSNPF